MRWPHIIGGVVAVMSLGLAACATAPAASVHAYPELEILKEGAKQKAPTPLTVLALYAAFAGSGRDHEGYAYFEALSKERPDDAVVLSLAGVFQARVANDVSLLSRIDWVNDAVKKLDDAVAKDPTTPRVFRGVVLAELPSFLGKAQAAVDDLQWAIAHEDTFAVGFRRPIYRGLAIAYATLGNDAESKAALAKSGYESVDPGLAQLSTDMTLTAEDGARFAPRRIVAHAPKIFSAEGYGFSDFSFIPTAEGIVVVDAGSSAKETAAALAAFRALDPAYAKMPVKAVLLTHAHFDHVDGLPSLLGAGVDVVANARFQEIVDAQNATGIAARTFRGANPQPLVLHPTKLVSAQETMTIGGVEFVLHPLVGGETDDSLIVEVPSSGTVLVGDAMMIYAGAPFYAEGSPEGMLDAIKLVRGLHPKVLLQGHTPLTERWGPESLEGLEAALRATYERTLTGIKNAEPLDAILAADVFPAALRDQPAAVVPFLATREGFIQRTYQKRVGYWRPDGDGVEPMSKRDWASVVGALTGDDDDRIAAASDRLRSQHDHALALKVAELGLVDHPQSAVLLEAKKKALVMLRQQNEQTSPFKLILYSEEAGAFIPPLP